MVLPWFSTNAHDGGSRSSRWYLPIRDIRARKAAGHIAGTGRWRLEIVRRQPGTKGFAVLPKRWIVERTLAWIRRNRRLARDVEHLARTAEAMVKLAMIKIMLRRLAR